MNEFNPGDEVYVDNKGPFYYVKRSQHHQYGIVNLRKDFTGAWFTEELVNLKKDKVEEKKRTTKNEGTIKVVFIDNLLKGKDGDFVKVVSEWINTSNATYGDAYYTLVKVPIGEVFNLFAIWLSRYPGNSEELETIKTLAHNDVFMALNG